MKIPSTVSNFLHKPMNRKEFFRHVGVAGLFVMGGGVIIRSLSQLSGNDTQAAAKRTRSAFAYGMRAYGGR